MNIIAVTLARQSQFSPILNALSRAHRITILAPDRTGEAAYARSLSFVPVRAPKGSPIEGTWAAFYGTARAVAEALQPLQDEKFDVVFGQASWGCTQAVRSVIHAAVVSHVELPSMEMKKARSEFPLSADDCSADEVQRSLVCGSLQRSDLVITPSYYARSLLPLDIQPQVRVCMEGFQFVPFRDKAYRKALRRRHGLPEDVPLLGFFGRTLEAVRGFDIFVHIARAVREVLPNAQFLVVGEPVTYYGNERSYLREESFKTFALRQAGMSESDFLFFRFQPHDAFRELLSTVNAAVFPIFENAGNWSFFECLATGTPTVVARTSFFPEVITDGENGFLCEVRDVATFTKRCVTLLNDPTLAERIGRAGWQTIQENFTTEQATKRYLSVFEEAAQRAMYSTP